MTRSTLPFDQRIADWLELDPNVAPPDVLSTVVAALPSIPQARRGLLAPRRFTFMQSYMRLAAVAAVVAVVGVGALTYFAPGGPGGLQSIPPTSGPASAVPSTPPGPSPTGTAPEPSTFVDMTQWTGFSSTAFGYDGQHPLGWRTTWGTSEGTAADLALAETTIAEATFWDHFDPEAANADFRILGTSTVVPNGTTEDEWITAYQAPQVGQAGRSCIPQRSSWETVTIDGRDGGIYIGCGFVEAMVFDGGRVYIFSLVSRGMVQVRVATDGRLLLEAFLSAIDLDPARDGA